MKEDKNWRAMIRIVGHQIGMNARNDNFQRVVPNQWQDHKDAWLAGYDNRPLPERQKKEITA
jgi:hypothetical protein